MAEAPKLDIAPIATFTPGIRENLRYDAPAGLVVFLVALPLCLGIALASGAPLISGMVTGVVGGILVSFLSGSHLSVSGPAAGLTVVVATGVSQVGSFDAMLMSVVIAGAWQITFGVLRGGAFSGIFPSSVIKGMLAGIGVLIILKQIPHALGYDRSPEGSLEFSATSLPNLPARGGNTFSELLVALRTWSGGAVVVSSISFAVLLLWGRPGIQKNRMASLVPAPLLAVVAGVATNELFRVFLPEMALLAENDHLVNLPVLSSFDELSAELKAPDLNAISRLDVHILAFTMAVIASLETLLCMEATDKLDPLRRISPKNRELMAQGAGNMVSGLLGGLPMTSVIVRSSANVYAGARTRTACFIHGVLLAGTALLFPALLNRIPLACLAAILILVGYKLASVSIVKRMVNEGRDQWVPFVVTILAIVFTDLLKGVAIGFAVGLFMVIRTNFYSSITTATEGKNHLIKFTKDVSFINNIRLKRVLAAIPDGSHVWIDASSAFFVDHDIQEIVHDFRRSASFRGITVEVYEMDGKQYPSSMRTQKI